MSGSNRGRKHPSKAKTTEKRKPAMEEESKKAEKLDIPPKENDPNQHFASCLSTTIKHIPCKNNTKKESAFCSEHIPVKCTHKEGEAKNRVLILVSPGQQEGNSIDLFETIHDFSKLAKFFHGRGWEIDKSSTLSANAVFSDVWKGITMFFCSLDDSKFQPPHYFLCFSGHGNGSGHWSLKKGEKRITILDLLNLWKGTQCYRASNSKLMIFSDACYSGKWIKEVKEKNQGVFIQTASDAKTEDGVFTKSWIRQQVPTTEAETYENIQPKYFFPGGENFAGIRSVGEKSIE